MSPPWGGKDYALYKPWWGRISCINDEEEEEQGDVNNEDDLNWMDMSLVFKKLAGIGKNYMFYVPKDTNMREIVKHGVQTFGASMIHISAFFRTMNPNNKLFVTNYVVSYLRCQPHEQPDNASNMQGLLHKWMIPGAPVVNPTENMMEHYRRGGTDRNIRDKGLSWYWKHQHQSKWNVDESYRLLITSYGAQYDDEIKLKGLRQYTGNFYNWPRDCDTDSGMCQSILARALAELLDESSTFLVYQHLDFLLSHLPLRELLLVAGWAMDLVYSGCAYYDEDTSGLSAYKDILSETAVKQVGGVLLEKSGNIRSLGGVFFRILFYVHRPIDKAWEKRKKELNAMLKMTQQRNRQNQRKN